MCKFSIGPARETEETWPFLSQCNLNILQNKWLHCQPFPSRSTHKILSPSSLSISVRHIEYSTFKDNYAKDCKRKCRQFTKDLQKIWSAKKNKD